MYASRQFRYILNWVSHSVGDRNTLHARSCQVHSDAGLFCFHGDLTWNLSSERILALSCVHGSRTSEHTRPTFTVKRCCGSQECHLHTLRQPCSHSRRRWPAMRGGRAIIPQGARVHPAIEADHLFRYRTDLQDFLQRDRLLRLGRQGTTERTSG